MTDATDLIGRGIDAWGSIRKELFHLEYLEYLDHRAKMAHHQATHEFFLGKKNPTPQEQR